MNNFIKNNKIKTIISVIFLLFILIIPNIAFSQNASEKAKTSNSISIIDKVSESAFNNILGLASNAILTTTAWLLSISGTFLNFAMSTTLQIGDFVKNNNLKVVESVWLTVRNISSIFIIFFLLYSSISIILGAGTTATKTLIGNIIIAGLLINFSLFFVRVGIDASNLVSMQFYRAIGLPSPTGNSIILSSFKDGGISDIFMSSLKIPMIYGNTTVLKAADVSFAIFVASIGGIIMMITASMSFIAAGIAIFARTGILLFLMALSPFYFVGMIFPQIKSEVSDKIFNKLKEQLLFLPIYLCFLYISLRLITSPDFNSAFTSGVNSNGVIPPGEGPFGVTTIGIIIQYIIAIIFINAPLIAALKFGAVGASWAPGLDFAKNFVGNIYGAAGRKLIGGGAAKAGKVFDKMAINSGNSTAGKFAAGTLRNLGISQAVRGGIDKAAKGKYGSQKSTEDYKKEDKERTKTLAGIVRTETNTANIKSYLDIIKNNGTPDPKVLKSFKDSVSGMDIKELEKLPFDTLSKSDFISHLSSSKFESLIKSDEITPDQKSKLKEAREKGFNDILTRNNNIGDYLINTHLKGKPEDVAKLPSSILRQKDVAEFLDPAMLKAIVNANVDKDVRDDIRSIIEAHFRPNDPVIQKSQRYLETNVIF